MSFWKVLSGVALGVGATLATSLAKGGSSATGATTEAATGDSLAAKAGSVMAAVSAVAGQVLNKQEEKKTQRPVVQESAAETEVKEKYEALTEELVKRSSEGESYWNFIVGLHMVGLAAANADGSVSDEEKGAINEFTSACASGDCPTNIVTEMVELTENPPDLDAAFEKMEQLNLSPEVWDDIEHLIEDVILADNDVDLREKFFLKKWQVKRQSA